MSDEAIARFAQALKDQESRGRTNLYVVGEASPDDAAKANRLAGKTGLPADVIERNLGEVEQGYQRNRNQRLVDRYPAIGKFTADPRDAAVSRDDVDGLAKVAKVFREREMLPQFRKTPRVPLPSDAQLNAYEQTGILPIGQEAAYDTAAYVRGIREMARKDRAEDFLANLPDTPGQAGRAVAANVGSIPAGLSGALRGAFELSSELSLGSQIQRRLFGTSSDDAIARYWAGQQAFGDKLAGDIRGAPNRNPVLRDVVSGFGSTPTTAIALGLSAAGMPQLGSGFVGAQVGGDAYGKARAKGLDPFRATFYGATQGAIEYATEKVPAARFFADTKAGASFARKLLNNLATEMPQEQAATALQDLNDWIVLNPEKPFSAYLEERPNAAVSTAIATAVGSTTSVTTIEAAGRLALNASKAAAKAQEAQQAKADARLLDQLAGTSVDSKVRQRDPDAFARFLAIQTNGTPVENVYVPAEDVVAYFQSQDIDWNDPEAGWGWDEGIAQQIPEALAAGGDIVIPTGKFVSHVAGTPAWDALKDHIRTSPGGMSLAEAEAFEKDADGAVKAIGEQFAEQSLTDDPRMKLYWSVRDKLTNAGFTQSAADANASLVAARYATRAARMGRDLTGEEFDPTEVRQVLPAGLAPIVAADQLDLAIATMKRAKAQRSDAEKFGPSLLDFIASKGGVEDRGGDLKSLGADKWHRGKPGKKKLLRPISETAALPGMGKLESSGYGLDDMALRAWEAGYFQGEERPSPNDLLDAIGEELGGKPRYAEDRTGQTDAMREAADELYALLDQRGIDPDKASNAEIKQAVAAYQQEQSEGNTYNQVDPRSDAFKRWFGSSKVVDANGMPLVVYHGTDQIFEAFDPETRGTATRDPDAERAFFFTSNPAVAEGYSKLGFGNPMTVPAYLKLERPWVHDMKGKPYDAAVFEKWLKYAEKNGRDGVIFKNVADDTGVIGDIVSDTYAVFNPTQIKSIHNAGTFDANDPRILYQSFEDGPRGRISFTNGRNIIELFEARNLSTFVHETGHLWLEELRADAESPNAPDQLKADWQAVQDWFAANGHPIADGKIPVEAHEMFARGWERYAMEGKSPSSGLRKVFDQFRSWLLSIYQVVTNLRAPISPEVRAVMDRLIATDEEIASTSEDQVIMALFTDAAQAGMTEAEFADYQATVGAARGEAFDALLFRTMERIRREKTKAFKDEEAGVKADVTASVNRQPVFRAIHLLRTGKILGDADSEPVRVKLDRQWLIETYGADALGLLPKGVPPIYADKDTTSADVVAEMVGFSSGDEMVRTMMAVEERQRQMREGGDKRSVRQALIDEQTAAVMTERHGDPLNDGSIEEEALAAIHNEKQGEVIASELRALSRKTGDTPTPYALARQWAARTIAQSQVADSTSGSALQRYARAAAKAGKAAQDSILKGDADEAFRQKQAQMLNNALIAEAKKAKDQVDTAVARLGKLARKATIKSIDQDYLDQVHGLLEQVEFRQRSQRDIDRQQSFEEWAAAQEAAGYDVVVPPSFATVLGQRNWSRLTVEELLGLDETVKQIVHLGRLKQKLLDGKDEREFNAVVDEALASIDQLPPTPPKGGFTDPSWWDSIKARVASLDAALLKMETVFDWLDGASGGVFNRVVFRRIADAQHRERAMIEDYTGRLTNLLKALPKAQISRWLEKVTIPELTDPATSKPMVTTRDRLISMALNMGNEGNAEKLAGGYGWSEEAVMRVLDRELTAEDWQYVQGVWDVIDTLWPEAQAMEKRLNGVAPDKVEARPVNTRHGVLRGGYFPVVYDPAKNYDAEAQAAKAADLFEASYVRANTRAGSLNERTSVKRPIHLSLGVINRHITEVIHDITHREAVMDAWRLLSDKRIMKAVDDTLGTEVRKQFKPWLQHIANEYAMDRTGTAGWEALAKKLRTNTSMVGMGFRLSTIMMQVAGYSNSFERVGAKWIIPQLGKVASPAAWRFVLERSPEVASRVDNMERDIRDNVRQLAGRTDPVAQARKFAFFGIGYMDRAVVIPTWLGAYNKAISQGMSEEDAGYEADKAVRQSQGAGAAKDLAAIQRGNEFQRLAAMFYSYHAALYQRMRTLGRDVRHMNAADLPNILARSFWLLAVPPVLSELLAGRGPDDDEDWAMWAAQKMMVSLLGPIPIVRDVAGALDSGFGYKFTPISSVFQSGINIVGDVQRILEGEETKRATRNAIEGAGYTLGLPTGQLAAAVQFIVDVAEGEQDPETVGDWFEGLSKGKLRDE